MGAKRSGATERALDPARDVLGIWTGQALPHPLRGWTVHVEWDQKQMVARSWWA